MNKLIAQGNVACGVKYPSGDTPSGDGSGSNANPGTGWRV